jgi:hypothetical protein
MVSVNLARLSWSVCAALFFAAGIVLLAEGYLGYAIVTLVIALAAAINAF